MTNFHPVNTCNQGAVSKNDRINSKIACNAPVPNFQRNRWQQQEDAEEMVSVEHFLGERERAATTADEDQSHAMAVTLATAAAASAAIVAAEAAAKVVRLAGGYGHKHSIEERAALRIQSFYRGYLARRALRGMKGLVRLQALVRGHNVRKQAQMTMRCMQALVRVQGRVRARRLGDHGWTHASIT